MFDPVVFGVSDIPASRDHGPPGLRPHHPADGYAASVMGPEGHNIEADCDGPEAAQDG